LTNTSRQEVLGIGVWVLGFDMINKMLESYKQLNVWQKSFLLSKEVYLLTENFPRHEHYGLTSQMRRAAVAIPSNIAEGYGRKSRKEYSQFCSIAYASNLELETQSLLSIELGFTNMKQAETVLNLITDVSKMLYSLIEKLKS